MRESLSRPLGGNVEHEGEILDLYIETLSQASDYLNQDTTLEQDEELLKEV